MQRSLPFSLPLAAVEGSPFTANPRDITLCEDEGTPLECLQIQVRSYITDMASPLHNAHVPSNYSLPTRLHTHITHTHTHARTHTHTHTHTLSLSLPLSMQVPGEKDFGDGEMEEVITGPVTMLDGVLMPVLNLSCQEEEEGG